MAIGRAKEWASGNWFLLLLPALFATSFFLLQSAEWRQSPRMVEAVTLFDWTVSVPLLFFLCYRSKLNAKQMVWRLLGLACLGVWLATWLVPAPDQTILPHLSWARTAGMAVLVLVELRLLVLALKFAFSGEATADELARKAGVPPLLAKLMLIEANFWRAVWRFISRR